MARWTIVRCGENLTLWYEAGGAPPKKYGEGPLEVEASLLAWVLDSAAPADVISAPGRGLMVRLAAPPSVNGRLMFA